MRNSRPDRVNALESLTGEPATTRYADARRILYPAVPANQVAMILQRVAPSLLEELHEIVG